MAVAISFSKCGDVSILRSPRPFFIMRSNQRGCTRNDQWLTKKKVMSKIVFTVFDGLESLGDGTCTRHYSDVIMGAMTSQITSLTIVYSTVYSGANQRKHQSSASLVVVWGIHRSPLNSPHKWPLTRKMFSFDDVIMNKHDQVRSVYVRYRHLGPLLQTLINLNLSMDE